MDPETLLLFIHPPLAIATYFVVFLNTIYTLSLEKERRLRITGLAAWLLCLGGLITGMIWAQLAWGTYWSWDPKETATLLLFLSLSGYLVALSEALKRRYLRILSIVNVVLVFFTLFVSVIFGGLHLH